MMDANEKDTPAIRIGIWGTAGAGKTTYLAMLYHVFQMVYQEWQIRAADDASDEFRESAYEAIFSRHRFPEKTRVTREYTFHVTYRGTGTRPPLTLTFLDAAGELFEAYAEKGLRDQHIEVEQRTRSGQKSDVTPAEIFQKLVSYDALLFLIDPAYPGDQTWRTPYHELLNQLFNDMQRARGQNPGLPLPRVALCLTKIDASKRLWWDHKHDIDTLHECYRHLSSSASAAALGAAEAQCSESCLIMRHLGDGVPFLTRMLPALIPKENVACFYLSSVGRRRVAGHEEPNIGVGAPWSRRDTPAPPVWGEAPDAPRDGQSSIAPEWAFLTLPLSETQTMETYQPDLISDTTTIAPYHLIEPILWLAGWHDLIKPGT